MQQIMALIWGEESEKSQSRMSPAADSVVHLRHKPAGFPLQYCRLPLSPQPKLVDCATQKDKNLLESELMFHL